MQEIPKIESNENELSPEELGIKFNLLDFSDFRDFLLTKIKENPEMRFSITTDWDSVQKARTAKAINDVYAKELHVDSITIRATRKQFEKDVNAFASGVKWEEIE
jgi:hypothetical protein